MVCLIMEKLQDLRMCSCLPAPASTPTFFTAYCSGSYLVITRLQFVSVFQAHLGSMGVSNPAQFRGHFFR